MVATTPLTDAEKVDLIKAALVEDYDAQSYNSGSTVALATTHPTYGGTITWSYNPTGAVVDGKWVAVGNVNTSVVATANIDVNGATGTQAVNITVNYIAPGSEVEQVIYSTGFESSEGFVAGTTYNNTSVEYYGNTGKQWGVIHGTPSTTSAITDSQSMQMRWYTGNTHEIYTFTNFDLAKISKVVFKAKNTSGINVIVSISKDSGTTWEAPETFTLSTTATEYTYNVAEALRTATMRVRFDLTYETAPTSTSRLYIDDVVIHGFAAANLAKIDLESVNITPTNYNAPTTLTLPTVGETHGSTIVWTSTNEAVINPSTGELTLPELTTNVTLTATATKGTDTDTKDFIINVKGEGEIIQEELNALEAIGPNIKESSVVLASTTTPGGYAITWSSTEPTVINPTTGAVTRGANNISVDLVATVNSPYLRTKTFNVIVIGFTEELDEELTSVTLPASTTENLTLPAQTDGGIDISWTSGNTTVISDTGVVNRQADDVTVTMTASVTKGGVTRTKPIDVVVVKLGGTAQPEAVIATLTYGVNKFTGNNANQNTHKVFIINASENIEATTVTSNNAYWLSTGDNAMRLGSSKNPGSITYTFAETVIIAEVRVMAFAYDTGQTLTIDGITHNVTGTDTDPAVEYVFDITDGSSFTISTAAKRVSIVSVTIVLATP
jgi:hypothetical protein